MLHLAASLHLLGVRLIDRAHSKLTTAPERGSETIEKVVWIALMLGIIGVVGLVIRNFVTSEAAKIK